MARSAIQTLRDRLAKLKTETAPAPRPAKQSAKKKAASAPVVERFSDVSAAPTAVAPVAQPATLRVSADAEGGNYLGWQEMPFEESEKHRKGLNTEEAALRILAKKFLLSGRVIPSSIVGECDAVVFTRAGLFVVEVKRWAGQIVGPLDADEWTIRTGAGERAHANPIRRLRARVHALSQLVQRDHHWDYLNHLWAQHGLHHTPVRGILCFGPTTRLETDAVELGSTIVCNTRNLTAAIFRVVEEEPSIPGSGVAAHRIGQVWPQEGRLTVRGRKGYVRCFPDRWDNSFACLHGAAEIKGLEGAVRLHYSEEAAGTFDVDTEVVIFRVFYRGKWRSFEVPSRLINRWTNLG